MLLNFNDTILLFVLFKKPRIISILFIFEAPNPYFFSPFLALIFPFVINFSWNFHLHFLKCLFFITIHPNYIDPSTPLLFPLSSFCPFLFSLQLFLEYSCNLNKVYYLVPFLFLFLQESNINIAIRIITLFL